MCLELPKLHERVERGTLPELAAKFAAGPRKGEIAIVIGGLTRAERSVAAGDDQAQRPPARRGRGPFCGARGRLPLPARARRFAAGPVKGEIAIVCGGLPRAERNAAEDDGGDEA